MKDTISDIALLDRIKDLRLYHPPSRERSINEYFISCGDKTECHFCVQRSGSATPSMLEGTHHKRFFAFRLKRVHPNVEDMIRVLIDEGLLEEAAKGVTSRRNLNCVKLLAALRKRFPL